MAFRCQRGCAEPTSGLESLTCSLRVSRQRLLEIARVCEIHIDNGLPVPVVGEPPPPRNPCPAEARRAGSALIPPLERRDWRTRARSLRSSRPRRPWRWLPATFPRATRERGPVAQRGGVRGRAGRPLPLVLTVVCGPRARRQRRDAARAIGSTSQVQFSDIRVLTDTIKHENTRKYHGATLSSRRIVLYPAP